MIVVDVAGSAFALSSHLPSSPLTSPSKLSTHFFAVHVQKTPPRMTRPDLSEARVLHSVRGNELSKHLNISLFFFL